MSLVQVWGLEVSKARHRWVGVNLEKLAPVPDLRQRLPSVVRVGQGPRAEGSGPGLGAQDIVGAQGRCCLQPGKSVPG